MLFRIFKENITDNLKIADEDFNYLTKTLRLKSDSKFEITDGTTAINVFQINSIEKKHLEASLIDTYTENNEPAITLTLIQGLPKNEKTELILQKGTELGISKFIFFEGEKSVVKLKNTETKIPRWNKIIESALCQSRRNYKPEIKTYPSLKNALQKIDKNIYHADQNNSAIPISGINKTESINLVIGPESGFSDSEKKLLQEKSTAVSLGKTTLRTETAAIAACAKLLL